MNQKLYFKKKKKVISKISGDSNVTIFVYHDYVHWHWYIHRYREEIPKFAAIFSRHEEQFGGIRFYSESACVNCIFLRYEGVFNRARKAATSATHIKVIARVICIAHSPHLFSAKSRIPQIAPHAGKKIYVGGIETLGSLSLYLWIYQFLSMRIYYVQIALFHTEMISAYSIRSISHPRHLPKLGGCLLKP